MLRILSTLIFAGTCLLSFAEPPVDPTIKERLLANLRAELAAQGVASETSAPHVHRDGSESRRLGADQTAILIATIESDGSLSTQCVKGVAAATDVLATGKVMAHEGGHPEQ